MNKYIDNFFILLMLIMPLTLITGPAIPDITISLTGIYFLIFITKKKIPLMMNDNLLFISILFWFFLLFISIFSENKILAYRDAIIFVRILIIPIFLYYWIFNKDDNLKKIIVIIFIATIFVCFDSIFQFLNYDPEIGFGKDIFGFESNFYGRLTGPFYNELIPGAFVSKFSLIGLVFLLIFINNKILKNISIIFYLSLVGIVCYISGERMALATFILGLIFLIFFLKGKRFTFLISLLAILLFSFIINKTHPIYNDYEVIESTPYHLGLKIKKEYPCKQNINDKCEKIIHLQPSFEKIIKNFDESAYGQIYSLAYKMWKDHPLQGIGLNNFTYLCNNDSRYVDLIKNYSCVNHPHNFYLQWLVETGIFGLILFIIYVFYLLLFIIRKNFSSSSIISIATMIILFWPIMSTGSLLKNWMGINTFFIIGICISLNKFKLKI